MSGRRKNLSSRLYCRVTLQQEVQTADGAGGTSKTWQNITDLWGEITPLIGNDSDEPVVAGQLQSKVTHRVILRYRTGVTAAMRLLYDSRIFNIRTVINVSENDEKLELLVQENVGT
jgi:SPP1 family predicted phage head-tail adaptor